MLPTDEFTNGGSQEANIKGEKGATKQAPLPLYLVLNQPTNSAVDVEFSAIYLQNYNKRLKVKKQEFWCLIQILTLPNNLSTSLLS